MSLIPLYMLTSFPNISVMFLFWSGGQYGKDDCSVFTMLNEFQHDIKLSRLSCPLSIEDYKNKNKKVDFSIYSGDNKIWSD